MRFQRPPGREIGLEMDGRVEITALSTDDARLVREIVEQAIESRLDHRLLAGRDCEGQHPLSAVEGLESELKKIPAPTEALTNSELEELLK